MSIELRVPEVGESIHEVQLGKWLKAEGDAVQKDEPVLEIETDKISVELPAPEAGVLQKRTKLEGDTAAVGEIVGLIAPGEGAPAATTTPAVDAAPTETTPAPAEEPPASAPGAPTEKRVMPAARRVLAESGLSASDVPATGPGGRLLKEDVLRHVDPHRPRHRRPPRPKPRPRYRRRLRSPEARRRSSR